MGKYLGIPVSDRKLNKRNANSLWRKSESNLQDGNLIFSLLQVAQLLLNLYFAAILDYYMEATYLPSSIHNELDRIRRNFIWGANTKERKIHLVGWDKVTKPKGVGGLGIKSAEEANIVAMTKLNWRLHKEKDKSWYSLFRSKCNITNPHNFPSVSGSPTWKAISKGYSLFCQGIRWIPRNGNNVSFWEDYWARNSPFSSILFGPHLCNHSSITVVDFFNAGTNGAELIGYQLPIELNHFITATAFSLSQSR